MGLSFPTRRTCSYTCFTSQGLSPTPPEQLVGTLAKHWVTGVGLAVRNHESVTERIEMKYNPSCTLVLACSA